VSETMPRIWQHILRPATQNMLRLLRSSADSRHKADRDVGEKHLRRILKSYLDYYHRSRTDLALGKDAPEPRVVEPPELGGVVELPQVGGFHHRYERRAA